VPEPEPGPPAELGLQAARARRRSEARRRRSLGRSRFDQGARSNAGAVGVLQLLPSTAAELKLDPLRSRTNVLAGALYLKQMLDRYCSPALALAAYNARSAAVDRVAGPPSFETAAYVANVQVWWRAFKGCT